MKQFEDKCQNFVKTSPRATSRYFSKKEKFVMSNCSNNIKIISYLSSFILKLFTDPLKEEFVI